MSRYANDVQDQYGRPIAGVKVYVYDQTGQLATLTADGGGSLANPVTTEADGSFYFNAADGIYTLTYKLNGRVLADDYKVEIGEGPTLPSEIVSALSQPGRAALIGSAGPSNVQADLNARAKSSDLAVSTGSSLVGFVQSGVGAVARPVQSKLRDEVSVFDFIPQQYHAGIQAETETTLMTAYIQAAFDAGAKKVVFPRGRYYTGPLTVPDWLHIEGIAYQPSIGGDGRAVELRFALTSGSGLTCGYNPVIRGVFFQNTGGAYNEGTQQLSGTTAAAITLTENAVLEDCCFSLWHKCVQTGANTFYLRTARLHFNRCTNGYYAPNVTPYDLHIDQPHSVLTNVWLTGAGGAYPRNVKVFGGSIEGYERVAGHFSDIAFFGTYFETEAPRTGVFAIEPGVNGANVGLYGCLIYATQTARFVNMSALTNAGLTSIGNTIAGAGPAGGFYAYLPASGSVSMHGDVFEGGHPDSYWYVDSAASAGRFNLQLPNFPASNGLAAYSGMHLINQRGYVMLPLTAEPTVKIIGMTVLADNATWDPLARAGTLPYWTMWNGAAWQSIDGGA